MVEIFLFILMAALISAGITLIGSLIENVLFWDDDWENDDIEKMNGGVE